MTRHSCINLGPKRDCGLAEARGKFSNQECRMLARNGPTGRPFGVDRQLALAAESKIEKTFLTNLAFSWNRLARLIATSSF
jgi:hypothetical protein